MMGLRSLFLMVGTCSIILSAIVVRGALVEVANGFSAENPTSSALSLNIIFLSLVHIGDIVSIRDQLRDQRQPQGWYDPAFRQVLYDHMPLIKTRSMTNIRRVEPAQAYKWIGNLKGLLSDLGITPDLHWVAMTINGLKNDFRDIESVEQIIVPDSTYINILWSIFTAKKR